MSKPETAASPHSPKSWAELLDQKGACFLEADSTEKRQEAAALLLNAVSSMLRHGGLGSPTPEAGKALGEISLALSELAEGLRPKLVQPEKRDRGRPPAGFQKMQRHLAVAACVEFLKNRGGINVTEACSLVSRIWRDAGFRASTTSAFNWHTAYANDHRTVPYHYFLLDQLQTIESQIVGGEDSPGLTKKEAEEAVRNLAQRRQ